MSYYRSYFEKNNTIIKNSRVNTAKSPTTDIYYGDTFSRFLFKIDLSDLREKITTGDLVLNGKTKHILHLTNTVFGDNSLIGERRLTGKLRATSFDLILFDIPEFWDEGIGYDSEDGVYDFSAGNMTYNEQPSNWFNRTILNNWEEDGIKLTESDVIKRIHFDNGNENIDLDITDYINDLIQNDTIYHGTGLCFDFVYENLNINTEKSVSFFTKYTQTFFEPYLESKFDDVIVDNRENFTEKIEQKLFLTINDGNDFVNLDNLPMVDIINPKNNSLVIFDQETELVRKGVYSVKLTLDNSAIDGRTFFKDIWKNIVYNGAIVGDIEQRFLPKKIVNNLTFNTGIEKTPKITFRTIGLLQNEQIKRGDIRKISLAFKSISDIKNSYKNVFYRIFIMEGRTEVNVIDWTLMDSGHENSFMFDTSYFIPREYTMEVKVKNGNEVITLNEKLYFEIVSER